MNTKRLFINFTLCLILYYLSLATVIGFATVFLQSKAISNTLIGLIFSCSSIFCILSQSIYSSFLDQYLKLSTKLFLIGTSIITIVSIVILMNTNKTWLIFLCYVSLYTVMLLNSSLFSSFAMEFINSGTPLNYSLSRGLGSFFYAGGTFIVGFLVNRFQISCIFPLCLGFQIILLVAYIFIKPADRTKTASLRISNKKEQAEGLPVFLMHNPNLLFLLISILFIYISYSSINNFQINILNTVGGGSKELGISSAIGAALELPAMALFLPLSRRISFEKILKISCFFFFAKVVCFSLATSVLQVYLAQCLQFASYGLFIPASTYYVNSILSDLDKTKGQSALGIFTFGLGGLIASLLSGTMLDHFSVHALLTIESVLALIGLIGVMIASNKLKKAR